MISNVILYFPLFDKYTRSYSSCTKCALMKRKEIVQKHDKLISRRSFHFLSFITQPKGTFGAYCCIFIYVSPPQLNDVAVTQKKMPIGTLHIHIYVCVCVLILKVLYIYLCANALVIKKKFQWTCPHNVYNIELSISFHLFISYIKYSIYIAYCYCRFYSYIRAQ